MIIFNEEKHTYVQNDLKFTSVTTAIKKLEEEKDWLQIATKYADKGLDFIIKDISTKKKIPIEIVKLDFENLDSGRVTGEFISNLWKTNGEYWSNIGSKFHKIKEDALTGLSSVLECQYNEKGDKIAYDLKTLKPGIYPELIVYNNASLLCGTSDKIIIYDDRTFDVEDYKFVGEPLVFESTPFFNYKKKLRVKEKMLPPIGHIDACNGMKYTIQLSLYAYMLEQYGYFCRNLFLRENILDKDYSKCNRENRDPEVTIKQENIIKVDYLKAEAKSIVDHFKYMRNYDS